MCSIEACVPFRCAFVLMHFYILPLDDLVHEQFQNSLSRYPMNLSSSYYALCSYSFFCFVCSYHSASVLLPHVSISQQQQQPSLLV
jgi:hypothetical protein